MRSSFRSWASISSVAILLAVGACTDDSGGTSEGTASTDESGIASLSNTNGDGDPTAGDGDPGDGDPTGDGDPGDGDPGGTVCGDGVVEGAESCDDGNTESGDGCSANCQIEGPIPCNGQIYECGDEIDNDMDGKVDLLDHECISPCDDSELTFKTNLPGQNNDCKGDCYFDSNSGGGDDKCEWNLKCDPENPGAEIGCEYDPNQMNCDVMLPQACLDFCVPLLPNGCDCFGCCEIDGQFIYLDGSMCSLDNLDQCQSCTFFEDCNNPCEPELCELCFGQDPEDLLPGCDGGECPEGVQTCTIDSMGGSECAAGYYCFLGCCELAPG